MWPATLLLTAVLLLALASLPEPATALARAPLLGPLLSLDALWRWVLSALLAMLCFPLALGLTFWSARLARAIGGEARIARFVATSALDDPWRRFALVAAALLGAGLVLTIGLLGSPLVLLGQLAALGGLFLLLVPNPALRDATWPFRAILPVDSPDSAQPATIGLLTPPGAAPAATTEDPPPTPPGDRPLPGDWLELTFPESGPAATVPAPAAATGPSEPLPGTTLTEGIDFSAPGGEV